MAYTYSIGIDIGGTNTDLGLVREDGLCVAYKTFSTSSHKDSTLYINELKDTIASLLHEKGIKKIEGIGIGAPNGNFYTGCIEEASNLPFLNNVPLRSLLEEYFGVPVAVSNDANAAAFGEMVYGGATDLQDFITITLGTGVGSGIIINRKLLLGQKGNAGELGHSIIVPEGRLCTCGRKGCLEEYASARGICKTFSELRKKNINYSGILKDTAEEQLSSKLIAEAAQQGDDVAIATYEETGYYVGLACANFVTFCTPQAIFLMGGPTKAGDIFLRPILKSFEQHLLGLYKGSVEIKLSELKSNDVAILGAAALLKNL